MMADAMETHSESRSETASQNQAEIAPQSASSSSPPTSTTSSPSSLSKRRAHSPLSIDLQNIPPLSQPSPPSNTLLVTQLEDINIFHPASLATIRQHINSIAPLHSFAPLKSFRRIVCSFYDTESAIRIRQHLDGAAILGETRARVYFGEPTAIGEEKKYLERPDAGRLFFISPPPSPPVGWEMRHEDPPNKEVYAQDLADKLAKLSGKMGPTVDETEDDANHGEATYTREQIQEIKAVKPTIAILESGSSAEPKSAGSSTGQTRSRSSTVIYDPEAHGDSPMLPAVKVEDYTMEDGDGEVKLDTEAKKIIAHTSRPPLELMNES
jgi:hypothetical protein